ncbi:MAG: isochorismatase family protein [Desulfobacterales bacterium]
MPAIINQIEKGDGLLLVDVQKDFCPGGRLAIENGDQVVPVLNRWIRYARERGIPIYASRDWHPVGHISFQEQGGQWPPHCIQDSDGARFHEKLALVPDVVKITKGVRFDQDQNSVFDQTGLAVRLRRDKVTRLWIGGLALDVCVKASVLDALEEGFEVFLLREATHPVTAEGGRKALTLMQRAGAGIVS